MKNPFTAIRTFCPSSPLANARILVLIGLGFVHLPAAANAISADTNDPPRCEAKCAKECPPGKVPSCNWTVCKQDASGNIVGVPENHIVGVPKWWVSSPCVNMRIEDEPLGYEPAIGPRISFGLSYRQRGVVPEDPKIFGVGPNWSCSFRAYAVPVYGWVNVHKLGAGWLGYWPGEPHPFDGSVLTVSGSGYRITYADGSVDDFQAWFTNSAGGDCHLMSSQTDPAGNSTTFNYENYPAEHCCYINATNAYVGPGLLGLTNCYLTNSFFSGYRLVNCCITNCDVRGSTVIGSSSDCFCQAPPPEVAKLISVRDGDGKTTTLYYENVSFPLQITKVVDPYNRTNLIHYDSSGYISNIVDVAGLTSWFKYDAGSGRSYVTNMSTPYGTNSFRYGETYAANPCQSPDPQIILMRFCEVTPPIGEKHLTLYLDQCTNFMSASYSPVPDTSPFTNQFDNVRQNMYNTFTWEPLQYAHLSSSYRSSGDVANLITADYAIGRLQHWLTSGDPPFRCGLGQGLSLERAPSPDGVTGGQMTWYDHDGKFSGCAPTDDCQCFEYTNTPMVPSFVALVLPDGSTRFTRYTRGNHNQVTQQVATYTKLDGSIGLRTNTYVYAANDVDLVQHIGASGEQVVSNYFGSTPHQPAASYDALNQETRYTYNASGQVLSALTPAGLTTVNTYLASTDGTNRLATTADVEIQRTNSYTYENGLVKTHTDERGLTITNFWDNLQHLTGVTYPDGSSSSNVYTSLDITATKDRLGFWSYATYNLLRQKVSETDPNSVTTTYNYCDCGALVSVVNAAGSAVEETTSYHYDLQGNRTNTLYADGYSVTNWFNSLGQVYQAGDGTTYRYSYYNNQGLVTNLSNSVGPEQLTTFDIEDRPIWVTDQNGVTITNTYDNLNRLRTRTFPDGGMESFGYSARGLIAHTNQIGLTNFFAYDEAGRKTFETNANAELIRYTNSAAGDLLSLTDGKSQTTRWRYDEYGRVTNKTDQAGTEILRYKYDADGRLTNRWSAEKGNTYYAFDPVGNLTNVNYPSSHDVSFAYDALNRRTSMVDEVGTTVYSYTAGNQLLTEDGPFSSDTVTSTYVNRLRTQLSLQQPTGVWTNGFKYDSATRLSNVIMQAGTFIYGYPSGLPSHLLSQLSLPNGSYIADTYDGNARLLSTTLSTSGNIVRDSYTYLYDPANERTNVTRADSSTVGFAYDKIGQLTVADSSVNTEDRGYTYDAAWNLNWRTNNGSASQFIVDNKNELTNAVSTTCTFDSNGNLTAAGVQKLYVYDDENRLSQWFFYQTSYLSPATGDLRTDLVYDGLGRLRERLEYTLSCPISTNIDQSSAQQVQPDSNGGNDCIWLLSSETHYIYDGWHVIQERDGNNTPTCAYTRGSDLSGTMESAGGIGGLLARTRYFAGSPTASYFYFADGNGNITCMIDINQAMVASYRYDPFGNTISKSGSLADVNVYRFSSKEIHVNSGMYYYGYRFYDPLLQRWVNRDPVTDIAFQRAVLGRVSLLDGPFEAANSPNLYTYVLNDAVNEFDPLGLLPPSNPACKALARKIANLEKEIRDRTRELYEDPQGLPGKAPGDDVKPSLSRRGHQKILNMMKANLAAKKAMYQANCSDPEPPKSCPIFQPNPMLAGQPVSQEGGLLGFGAMFGALGLVTAPVTAPAAVPLIAPALVP